MHTSVLWQMPQINEKPNHFCLVPRQMLRSLYGAQIIVVNAGMRGLPHNANCFMPSSTVGHLKTRESTSFLRWRAPLRMALVALTIVGGYRHV